MKEFDVVIVGGGIVGTSLASALAQFTPLSIALIEANNKTSAIWQKAQYDHRVSAITLASKRIFQHLKIWDAMCERRVSPFSQIKVWDGIRNGEICFRAEDIAEAELGYIIENNLIKSLLEEKIKEQSRKVTYLKPVQLISAKEEEEKIVFKTRDDEIIFAKLAIAADGTNSWLREQFKFKHKCHDYDQHAIVATVETTLPHETIARQVFLESGPLAFLPLACDKLSSIVWSLPTKTAKDLFALEEKEFKLALAKAFSYRLGDIVDVSKRYMFPLQKKESEQYVKPRVVLVGDAAHTVHPLAGLGFNMGLLDVACLTQVIVEALQRRQDFAAYPLLRRYERWRKADNFAVIAGIDIIKNLFASDKRSFQLVRSFGLNTTNRFRILRNFFARFAVGNRRGLPQLALSESNGYE